MRIAQLSLDEASLVQVEPAGDCPVQNRAHLDSDWLVYTSYLKGKGVERPYCRYCGAKDGAA